MNFPKIYNLNQFLSVLSHWIFWIRLSHLLEKKKFLDISVSTQLYNRATALQKVLSHTVKTEVRPHLWGIVYH